jgi:hypothetical protein
MNTKPFDRKNSIAYAEFDEATADLIPGLNASFILEVVRIALQDPDMFAWTCECMDVNDTIMQNILERIVEITNEAQ